MNVSRLGPFALEEKLGGPHTSVYRAIHLQQRRQVALKVFPLSLAANSHARNEFSDEMDLLKRLKDPHIVRCFGGSLEPQHGYLALEIVEGETLAELMARRGRLGWEQAVEIAQQITFALQTADELGLTHQDLTPDKIMLPAGPAGSSLKVLDFRLQRHKNPLCISSQTRTAARLAFQAPEQIRREENISSKADLYALGCLLYLMLTGHPPFPGSTVDEIATGHLTAIPQRVSALALECPVWLDALVTQLLEKDPARRPHSAGAVVLALQETKSKVASGGGVTQHALGGISSLKMDLDKDEVRKLVGRKTSQQEERLADETPIYERPWFLVTCLSVLLLLLGFVVSIPFWPMSEEHLIAQADKLMASEDPTNWREAELSYLLPLLKQYPDGKYASRAQEHLDTIEMKLAENRLRTLLRLGQEPKTEAERLYAEGMQFEKLGDRVSALDRYQSMTQLLQPEGADRPFLLLAKRQLAKIESDSEKSAQDRGKFIDSKLAQAEALHAAGNVLEARKLLHSLINAYGKNAQYAPQVARVQKRLAQLGDEAKAATNPPAQDAQP